MTVKTIPEGCHSVTPYLSVKGAAEAMDFDKRAFNATELFRLVGGSSVGLHVYVEDVDALFAQAVAAGAKAIRPVQDQFYGDRTGTGLGGQRLMERGAASLAGAMSLCERSVKSLAVKSANATRTSAQQRSYQRT